MARATKGMNRTTADANERIKAAAKHQNGTTPQATGGELIPESQVESAPEGFEELFGGRVLGFWNPTPGNVLQGVLVDSFTTKSKFSPDGKKVYKIQLTKPGADVQTSPKDEETPSELVSGAVGDIVGVDEKGFLQALSRAVVGQEIWVAYRGKEGPSGDYPQGRHLYVGPVAKPVKVNPVTGEVRS